jgi:predicted transcriptional regulator
MKAKKFATQIDETVLKNLKDFAKATDKSISRIVNDAVKEYVTKAQVRPVFQKAMDEVIKDHAELLQRLAK